MVFISFDYLKRLSISFKKAERVPPIEVEDEITSSEAREDVHTAFDRGNLRLELVSTPEPPKQDPQKKFFLLRSLNLFL